MVHRSLTGMCGAAALLLLLPAVQRPAFANAAPQANTASASTVLLSRDDAAKLMPATVFFAGKTAPVQARNTGGLRLAKGRLVLASLVDTSGYSSGIQNRYQAYLLTEAPLSLEGKTLPIGAYGCGFVAGKFLVLNLAGDTIFSVPATHDTAMSRPNPLQFLADPKGGYRLYSGRDFVSFRVDPR